jgi:hypothetical protein
MMRTIQQQRNYEQLEQLPPQVFELANLGLRQIWRAFSDFWQAPSQEPQVHQKIDRNGKLYWEIYDSLDDCLLHFDNEQDVVIWLEEQPYRRVRPIVGA